MTDEVPKTTIAGTKKIVPKTTVKKDEAKKEDKKDEEKKEKKTTTTAPKITPKVAISTNPTAKKEDKK